MPASPTARAPLPAIEQSEGARPLSRRASRRFVLVALVVMVAMAATMAVYLTRTARSSSGQLGTQSDNRSSVPGFGVTNAPR